MKIYHAFADCAICYRPQEFVFIEQKRSVEDMMPPADLSDDEYEESELASEQQAEEVDGERVHEDDVVQPAFVRRNPNRSHRAVPVAANQDDEDDAKHDIEEHTMSS